jgi:hypothetical protein
VKDKRLIGIIVLGFALRIFYAHLDPFLHGWDEKFHALVASNFASNPLMPLLHRHTLYGYDYTAWCCNHIWVHKQPQFMWQMALSIKLFGYTAYAVRYPSVLMGTLLLPMIYRMALLYTKEVRAALLASLFYAVSYYQLELTSGFLGMDHNDIAFCFYVGASLWALCEYVVSGHAQKWAYLIGVFAGAAILNKWLVGLLVFAPMGIYALLQLRQNKKWQVAGDTIKSLLVCIAVAAPWQLYILSRFNKEAVYEFAYNAKHITQALEGHKTTPLFYVERFDVYYGNGIWILMLVGIMLAIKYRDSYNKTLAWMLSLSYVLVYVFFSIIVQSRMSSYVFIVAPIGFIFAALAVFEGLKFLKFKSWCYLLVLAILFLINNPLNSLDKHGDDPLRKQAMHNSKYYQKLEQRIPSNINIVVNMPPFNDIDVEYYNRRLIANQNPPDRAALDSLEKEKIWIAAFMDRPNYKLSTDAKAYKYLYVIKDSLY